MTPREQGRTDRDRDVRRDAHGLYRETKQLTVEERAEYPEHVEIHGRVVGREVAQIVGRVESRRSDLDQMLGPGLEGADVGWKAHRAQYEQAHGDAERDETGDGEICAAIVARARHERDDRAGTLAPHGQ